jgi:hypothetical protein
LGPKSTLQGNHWSEKGPKGKYRAAVDQDDVCSFCLSLKSVDRVSKKQLDTQGVSQQPRPRYLPVPTGAHVTESSERSREKGAKADVYRKLKRRQRMSLKESRRIAEECSRIEERLEDDIAEKCSLYAAMDEIMVDMMPKGLDAQRCSVAAMAKTGLRLRKTEMGVRE